MSCIPFRQRCEDCAEEWNTAFGVLGMTIAWDPLKKCPHCNSKNLKRVEEDLKESPSARSKKPV